MHLVFADPPTVLGDPFETLQGLLGWSEDTHMLFSES